MTELILQPLTVGRCYVLSGTVEAEGASGVVFYAGNNETTYSISSPVYGDGDTISLEFTYPEGRYYQSLFMDITGTVQVNDMQLLLDEECAEGYCSECYSLEECREPEYLTLQWTNDDDGFGINYTSLPLVHSLTVKGGLRNADYTYDEDYHNTSAGRYFPVYVDSVKMQEMWVERVPEYIHDALRLGVVHDHFTINGESYSKAEGGYSPDWNTPQSLLAPVIVKVRKRTQDTKNINC